MANRLVAARPDEQSGVYYYEWKGPSGSGIFVFPSSEGSGVSLWLPRRRMKFSPSHTTRFPLCVRRKNIEGGCCSILEACEGLGVRNTVEDSAAESSSYSCSTLLSNLIPGVCDVEESPPGVLGAGGRWCCCNGLLPPPRFHICAC
jgi:hypothetical protein